MPIVDSLALCVQLRDAGVNRRDDGVNRSCGDGGVVDGDSLTVALLPRESVALAPELRRWALALTIA